MPNVYVLKKQDDAFLTVQIGSELYKIPLTKSLKHSEVRKISRYYQEGNNMAVYDYFCDLFERFIPKEILDQLDEGEFDQLIELWKKGNEVATGMSLGESSASADLSTSTRQQSTTTSLPEQDTQ